MEILETFDFDMPDADYAQTDELWFSNFTR